MAKSWLQQEMLGGSKLPPNSRPKVSWVRAMYLEHGFMRQLVPCLERNVESRVLERHEAIALAKSAMDSMFMGIDEPGRRLILKAKMPQKAKSLEEFLGYDPIPKSIYQVERSSSGKTLILDFKNGKVRVIVKDARG